MRPTADMLNEGMAAFAEPENLKSIVENSKLQLEWRDKAIDFLKDLDTATIEVAKSGKEFVLDAEKRNGLLLVTVDKHITKFEDGIRLAGALRQLAYLAEQSSQIALASGLKLMMEPGAKKDGEATPK